MTALSAERSGRTDQEGGASRFVDLKRRYIMCRGDCFCPRLPLYTAFSRAPRAGRRAGETTTVRFAPVGERGLSKDYSDVHYSPLIWMIGEAGETKEDDPITASGNSFSFSLSTGRFNGKSLVCGTTYRSKRDPAPTVERDHGGGLGGRVRGGG